MKQLTKKAYSRKAVIIGAVAFSAIALTATGVAAFVLSASSESNPQGGLHVGVVDTKAIKIQVNDMNGDGAMSGTTGYVIDFDPEKNDSEGRIRWDNQQYERMSNTVTGIINPASVAATSKVTAKLTMGYYDSSEQTWTENTTIMENFKEAAKDDETHNQYITLPECFDNEVELTTDANNKNYYLALSADAKDTYDFSITFAFGWGTFFKGMNPSRYYDEDVDGKAKSDAEMGEEMNAFMKALFGEEEQTGDLAINYKLTIKVDTTAVTVSNNT